jgi:hypothetical protein
MVVIIDEIRQNYTKTNEKGKLKFIMDPEFYGKLSNFVYDMVYIFQHKNIAEKFLNSDVFLEEYLKLNSYLQECLEISKEMDNDSSDWITPFHFENASLFRTSSLMIDSMTESTDIEKILHLFNNYLSLFLSTQNWEENEGIIQFNPLKDHYTFRIPIHRFFSQFLYALIKQNKDIPTMLKSSNLNLKELLEHPLRLQVLKYHIHRRLWPRNNCQIIEQLINYTSLYPISSYNLDIFLIQIISCCVDIDEFYHICVDRFKLNDDLFLIEPKPSENNLTQSLEEDLISFVLTLYNDRIFTGNSNEKNARDYILHELFLNKSTHSKLQKCVPKIFRENQIEEKIISEVSSVQKVKNSNSEYTPKKESWKELNIYYSNYLPRDIQEVELNFKKSHKEEMKLNFPGNPFECLKKLKKLISCSSFQSILFVVLFRTLNNLSAPKLLNSCLHGLIFALNAECEEEFEIIQKIENQKEIKSYKDVKFPSKSLRKNMKFEVISNNSIYSLLLEIRKRQDLLNEQKVYIDEILNSFGGNESPIEKKEVNDREKKLKEAKERQKQIQDAYNKQMASFDESMFEDDPDVGLEDEEENSCVFCHSKHSPGGNPSVGYISQLSKSHSVKFTNELNYIESKEGSFSYDDLKKVKNENIPWKEQPDEIDSYFTIGEHSELFRDVNKSFGIQLNSCKHICHFDCLHTYFMSLLQKNNFKGDWCLFLDHLEILCPVCGRLANAVVPIIDDKMENLFSKYCSIQEEQDSKKRKIEQNFFSFYDEIYESCKTFEEIKEKKIEDFTLEASLMQLLQRMTYVSDDFQSIEEPTNPSILYSCVSYSIASQEILMRNSDLFELPNNEELKNLISGVNHILNFKFQNKKSLHLSMLLKCILGKTNDLSMEKEKGILPFLSTDLFSTFVRLLLLRTEYTPFFILT